MWDTSWPINLDATHWRYHENASIDPAENYYFDDFLIRRVVCHMLLYMLHGIYTNIFLSAIITGLIKVILGYRHGSSFPSYSNTQVWATLHAGLSIVCASLPVLRPLARRISRSPFITNAPNIFFIRRLSRKPNSTIPETASEPSTFREASRRNHSADSLRGNK